VILYVFVCSCGCSCVCVGVRVCASASVCSGVLRLRVVGTRAGFRGADETRDRCCSGQLRQQDAREHPARAGAKVPDTRRKSEADFIGRSHCRSDGKRVWKHPFAGDLGTRVQDIRSRWTSSSSGSSTIFV
jgi:hypothetical protein